MTDHGISSGLAIPDVMKRCPECLSAVEETDSSCPQCGASFVRKRRGVVAGLGILGLSLTVGLAWWAWGKLPMDSASSSAEGQAGESRLAEIARRQSSSELDEPENETRLEANHLQFLAGSGKPFSGLLLAGAQTLVFITMEDFPMSGGLQGDPGAIDFDVATYDRERGFVLLGAETKAAEGTQALPLGDFRSLAIGEELRAVTPRGESIGSLSVASRAMDGRLELNKRLERASAILDLSGGAVAYALGGLRAMSLEDLIPWMQYRGLREVEEVQAELRNLDPGMILQAQTRILADMNATTQSIRKAIEEVRRAGRLATDADMVRQFIDAEKYGLQRLVLNLSNDEPEEAISILREGLGLFPDDPTLLSQAVQLMAIHGDPMEAIAHFRQLLRDHPERGKRVAESLGRGLAAKGAQLVQDGRFEAGLQLLASASELFPLRADLHMTYAQALSAAGQDQAALSQAQEAARLDPAYERQLATFSRKARPRGLRRGSRRTEIPFDPQTNVIRADVKIGGFPLELVVDTGASITIIPVDLAKRLSLIDGSNRGVRVQTASGMAEGLLVELPILQIGRIQLQGLEAIALDLPNSLQGKGLLGMNALSQMNMQIDSERGRLILGGKR